MNIELFLASLILTEPSTKIYLSNRQLCLPTTAPGYLLTSIFNDPNTPTEFAIRTWFPTKLSIEHPAIPDNLIRLFVFTNEDYSTPAYWCDMEMTVIKKMVGNIWDRLAKRVVSGEVVVPTTPRVVPTQNSGNVRMPLRLQPGGITLHASGRLTINGYNVELATPEQVEQNLYQMAMAGIQQQNTQTPETKEPVFNTDTALKTNLPPVILSAITASLGMLSDQKLPILITKADHLDWPEGYTIANDVRTFAVAAVTVDTSNKVLTSVSVRNYEALQRIVDRYRADIHIYLSKKIANSTAALIVNTLPTVILTLQVLEETRVPVTPETAAGLTNQFGALGYAIIDIVGVNDTGVTIDIIPYESTGNFSAKNIKNAHDQPDQIRKEIAHYDDTAWSAVIDVFHKTHPNTRLTKEAKDLIAATYAHNYDLCTKHKVSPDTLRNIIMALLWDQGPYQMITFPEEPVVIDAGICQEGTGCGHAVFDISCLYGNIVNLPQWATEPDVKDDIIGSLRKVLDRYNKEKRDAILTGSDKYRITRVMVKRTASKSFKLEKI